MSEMRKVKMEKKEKSNLCKITLSILYTSYYNIFSRSIFRFDIYFRVIFLIHSHARLLSSLNIYSFFYFMYISPSLSSSFLFSIFHSFYSPNGSCARRKARIFGLTLCWNEGERNRTICIYLWEPMQAFCAQAQ